MFRICVVSLLLLILCSGPAAAMRVQLAVGSIEHPALPAPIKDLRFDCTLQTSENEARCRKGSLRALLQQQRVSIEFDARVMRNGDWSFEGSAHAKDVTYSDATGRYAAEKLDLDATASATSKARVISAKVQAVLPSGQVYVEPVFIDFGIAPAKANAQLRFDARRNTLDMEQFDFQQTGVLHASGSMRQPAAAAPAVISLQLHDVQLAPSFTTYLQPFLAGTQLEKMVLSGAASGHVELRGAAPQKIALTLKNAGFESGSFEAGVRDLRGNLNWQASGTSAESNLEWTGGHVSKLELGPSALRFQTAAKDFQLLAPLKLPVAGGALNIRELAVTHAGQPDMGARFDAEIEPLDLPTLTRAFGWPEFGGQLAGRLPGLSLKDGELKLDGALTAKAFNGEVAVDGLRVIDPFGRVPRVEGDIRLRNLDLAAVTGAFSFGRIEGRLDGDVQDLRLLNWQPISFRARLATPPTDKSRHRISQRAIDNISSVGGGPTGVLQRGALRFFEDFAYERIGWSCVLSNNVCHMDGIEPARNGGYVLVKGRLVPRIDVVGYNRQVDWNTFISQLKTARQGQGIEVR